jgi:hypothetical protein
MLLSTVNHILFAFQDNMWFGLCVARQAVTGVKPLFSASYNAIKKSLKQAQ